MKPDRSWLIAGVIVIAGCAPAPSLKSGREAFAIDLPAECRMEARSAHEDFQVFNVVCGERPYAGVYTGNHPDPSVRDRTLKTEYAWPLYVQAWSLSVPGDQARADAIANSVKLKPH